MYGWFLGIPKCRVGNTSRVVDRIRLFIIESQAWHALGDKKENLNESE